MRTYTASIYTDGGNRYFDVRFQAEDYWAARRYIEATWGTSYNYLTEASN